MGDYQDSKRLVRQFYAAMETAAPEACAQVLREYVADDYHWRGMHPFYEQHGADAVVDTFWQPLLKSFKRLQRRQDVFMAGTNAIDGESEWVCSMGHLMGLFDEPWLDIPPTGKLAFLRYCDFHRIADGKIVETALFCDILSVMRQAGLNPLPESTGVEILTPGPRTHDGLLYEPQDPAESRKSLDLVNAMKDDLVNAEGFQSPDEELARTWHDDMLWFGPAGIGATYTISRYQDQHQGPFRAGLANVDFQGHVCCFAEGDYAGWFGWPNLTMQPVGSYLGMPAHGDTVEMRVVDIYRRDGDKLAENWIFIDHLYFLKQQGLDVLERNRALQEHRRA
ncbi:MAG: ester cyclase [Pseudomonadota bacterium]